MQTQSLLDRKHTQSRSRQRLMSTHAKANHTNNHFKIVLYLHIYIYYLIFKKTCDQPVSKVSERNHCWLGPHAPVNNETQENLVIK
jgi:hypothetical protein